MTAFLPNQRVLVFFADTESWSPASVMSDHGRAYVLVHLDHSRTASLPRMAGEQPVMMVRKALVKPADEEQA